MSIDQIAAEALRLPAKDRALLAESLWESLSAPYEACAAMDDQDFSPEVETVWEEEICRRMKSVTTGAARARSFDAVFAELDRRFGP